MLKRESTPGISFEQLQQPHHWQDRLRTLPWTLRRGNEHTTQIGDPLSFVDFSQAQRLIAADGTVSVLNGTNHPAYTYWKDAGMPNADITAIVDTKSRLIFRIPDTNARQILHISKKDPLAGGMQLIDALAPLYDANGFSLHASLKGETPDRRQKGVDGFNDHRRPHIRTVLRGALALLDQAQTLGFRTDITPWTKQTTALAAAIHDSVNIFSRKHHASGIPVLLPHIMPTLTKSPLWHDVAQIGVFHNEPQVLELLKTLPSNHTTIDEIAKLETLGPGTLATIIADKLHIGPDRLPDIWTDPDGILRDWNVGINACFATESAGYTEDGSRFIANLHYNPHIEAEMFAPLLSETARRSSKRYAEGRTTIPRAIHDYLRKRDIPDRVSHSEVLEAMLWETYKDRLRLTIMAAFAFNPHAQTVEITISDPDARRGLGEDTTLGLQALLPPERIEEVACRQYAFSRNHLDEELAAIEQKFVTKGIDLPALKQAGDALLPKAQTVA